MKNYFSAVLLIITFFKVQNICGADRATRDFLQSVGVQHSNDTSRIFNRINLTDQQKKDKKLAVDEMYKKLYAKIKQTPQPDSRLLVDNNFLGQLTPEEQEIFARMRGSDWFWKQPGHTDYPSQIYRQLSAVVAGAATGLGGFILAPTVASIIAQNSTDMVLKIAWNNKISLMLGLPTMGYGLIIGSVSCAFNFSRKENNFPLFKQGVLYTVSGCLVLKHGSKLVTELLK